MYQNEMLKHMYIASYQLILRLISFSIAIYSYVAIFYIQFIAKLQFHFSNLTQCVCLVIRTINWLARTVKQTLYMLTQIQIKVEMTETITGTYTRLRTGSINYLSVSHTYVCTLCNFNHCLNILLLINTIMFCIKEKLRI